VFDSWALIYKPYRVGLRVMDKPSSKGGVKYFANFSQEESQDTQALKESQERKVRTPIEKIRIPMS